MHDQTTQPTVTTQAPKKLVFFDTETTGKYDFQAGPKSPCQPHLVQLAAMACDSNGSSRAKFCLLIKPDGWAIPAEASAIHGITTEIAERHGVPLVAALSLFQVFCTGADLLVAHNAQFDVAILDTAFTRAGIMSLRPIDGDPPIYCTMRNGAAICKLPGKYFGYKWPKLSELCRHLFGVDPTNTHDALCDVETTARCYFEMTKNS